MSELQTNANEYPYKQNEYLTFVLWKSFPAALRKMSENELLEFGFTEEQLDIVRIKNYKEFSKRYSVDPASLVRWTKLERFNSDVEKMVNKSIRYLYKPALDHKFTQMTLKYCDAPRVALWKKLYEGWSEKGDDMVTPTAATNEENINNNVNIQGQDVMTLILSKIAKKNNLDVTKLIDINTEAQDAVIVEDEKFPSDMNYDIDDFEEQYKKEEDVKSTEKEKVVTDEESIKDVKSKLIEKLSNSVKDIPESERLKMALKRSGKKNGHNT